jgi:Type II secretion system (T2SS), protein E, N-terminal domain
MGLPLLNLSAEEEAQLTQTIEMFEVITQGQPQDSQSLEILKEAYVKLGKEDGLIVTSKRLAEAYSMNGQISSAIMEYESLLQHKPDDKDVQRALAEIEARANEFRNAQRTEEPSLDTVIIGKRVAKCIDDGAKGLRKAFVGGKFISEQDFENCWIPIDHNAPPGTISTSFVQAMVDRSIMPVERAMRILMDKARVGYIPLSRYDVDVEAARKFDPELCRRWCILPFDRMSKTMLVATANPFNEQAAHELEESNVAQRYLFYLAPPAEIVKGIQTCFRQ